MLGRKCWNFKWLETFFYILWYLFQLNVECINTAFNGIEVELNSMLMQN